MARRAVRRSQHPVLPALRSYAKPCYARRWRILALPPRARHLHAPWRDKGLDASGQFLGSLPRQSRRTCSYRPPWSAMRPGPTRHGPHGLCASFLMMDDRNITEALAYDRDFEQAGFTRSRDATTRAQRRAPSPRTRCPRRPVRDRRLRSRCECCLDGLAHDAWRLSGLQGTPLHGGGTGSRSSPEARSVCQRATQTPVLCPTKRFGATSLVPGKNGTVLTRLHSW